MATFIGLSKCRAYNLHVNPDKAEDTMVSDCSFPLEHIQVLLARIGERVVFDTKWTAVYGRTLPRTADPVVPISCAGTLLTI